MIVDSSAVVAVLLREGDHEDLELRMRNAPRVAISGSTLFETEMVMVSAMGEEGLNLVARLRKSVGIEVIPFDASHCGIATKAFVRFGKGRHPAALNYGDCMTYATARLAGRPLLFKGNDFARTDLEAA